MRKTIAFLVFVGLSAFALPTLAAPHYPMSADEFQETVDRRVEATWDRIEKKLIRQKVSEERRQEIRRAFDEAVEVVTAAMDKASADGSITRGEAWRINTMTSGLRGKLRGKLAVERTPASARKTTSERADDGSEGATAADRKAKKGAAPASKHSARKSGSQPESNDADELDSKRDTASAKPVNKKRH
jgi:hypothetical protein